MQGAQWLLAFTMLTASPIAGVAQQASSDSQTHPAQPPSTNTRHNDTNRNNSLGKPYLLNLWQDQRAIWTSPARIRIGDLNWLVPVGGLASTLIYTDQETSQRIAPHTDLVSHSKTFSDYAVLSMAGATGSMYLWGKLTSNEHARETGLLGSEAVLNGLFVNEVIKSATQRERPFENTGQGRFWVGGSSFPSSHAVVAWSLAAVLANEYPGILTKTFAYGSAAAVSVARVSGRQHFPSDVLVGSTIGYLIGRQVYRAHHNPELSGAPIASSTDTYDALPEERASPANIGSPYVPLDSWVYSAFDKLEALGFAPSAISGLRPWTRAECVRLLNEAEERSREKEVPQTVDALLENLRAEFVKDTEISGGSAASASLDSIYSRYLGISGSPLTDGYHFASTIVNDYGRPFGEGSNVATGISAHSILGPVSLYVRAEYQHAPSSGGISPEAAAAISEIDGVPSYPTLPRNSVDRLRLIEGYVTFMVSNVQFSFGQQALWWGPGRSGPMLLSNNAESLPMFRISRTTPFRLPSFLSYLGPMRSEFFFARLHGHDFILQQSGEIAVPNGSSGPYLHGMKLSFKPTPNLEFGFSRTVLMGGFGHPLTTRSLWKSITSVGDRPNTPVGQDVGDRRGGFDFTYRIPKLRDWLVLYCDSMSDDDPSPLANPASSAWNPGIYLPKLPHLPKLDFRVEGVNTDSPGFAFSGVNYQNIIYRSGYTNYGQLLATWAGRQSKGVLLSSKYSFAPRTSIELTYRKQKVSPHFLSGGAVDDFRVAGEWFIRKQLGVSTWVQYERWKFPLLSATLQQNVSVSLQLTYWPKQALR